MTSLASSHEEDGLEPSQQYRVPLHLSPAGRRAFHGAVRGFAGQLAQQMVIDAQRRTPQVDPEYTADHVHDAQRAVERQNALRVEQDRSDRRVLGAILLAVGSLGITVLSNFLVGPLQVLAFALAVIVLVAGLILTWTGRARHQRGEP